MHMDWKGECAEAMPEIAALVESQAKRIEEQAKRIDELEGVVTRISFARMQNAVEDMNWIIPLCRATLSPPSHE